MKEARLIYGSSKAPIRVKEEILAMNLPSAFLKSFDTYQ